MTTPNDLPDGATVEPWTDDDDREAEREAYAALTRRQTWTAARYGAARWRAGRVAWLEINTGGPVWANRALAEYAIAFGLVGDRETDPQRQREIVDVWLAWATARHEAAYGPSGARYYEDSDGFEERERLAGRARWPAPERGWWPDAPPLYLTHPAIYAAADDTRPR